MNNLTEVQTATKLLGLLCEKGNLDNVRIDQFFKDTGQDAVYVCKELEKEWLISVVWLDAGRIANIKKTDKTKNAFENESLMEKSKAENRFKRKEKIDFKIKRIELCKQYWWVACAIFTIILTILYAIVYLRQ